MIAATHPVSPEEVMALADGELSASEATAVLAHIAECSECASLASQLATTSASFAKWTVPDAPLSLDASVASLIKDTGAGKHATGSARVGFAGHRWSVAQMSAVAVVLLLVAAGVTRLYHARSNDAIIAERFETDRLSESRSAAGDAVGQPMPAPPPPATESFSYNAQQSDKKAAPSARILNFNLAAPSIRAQKTESLEAKSVAPASPTTAQIELQTAPMIAHSVSLTVQVRDLGASRAALEALLARHRGYAAELTVNTAEGSPRSLQGSLRIPDADLAAAIAELRALGRVETENQSGEEVTQQHADLVARLQNSREAEQRLRELLAQRTGRVSDVLEVEEEISRVRGAIEQMEADQKLLEHRVDFASVELQLTEQYREQLNTQSTSVGMQMRNAFVAGLRHGAATLLGFVLFLEEAVPTVLIWLAILAVPGFLLWRRYRRIRARI
jgi:hypothetical protein